MLVASCWIRWPPPSLQPAQSSPCHPLRAFVVKWSIPQVNSPESARGPRTHSDQMSSLPPCASWLLLPALSLWEPGRHTFIWTASQNRDEKTNAKVRQNILQRVTRNSFQYLCFAPHHWLEKAFSNCISFDLCLACSSNQLPRKGTDSLLCSFPSVQISDLRSHHVLYYLNPRYIECLLPVKCSCYPLL